MARVFNLSMLRGKLGLEPAQMADRMGLETDELLALEAAPEKVERRHQMLAHMASLDVALDRGQPALASTTIREKIKAWHALNAAQAET